MFEIGSYVLTEKYGIGIVKEVLNDNLITISFGNKNRNLGPLEEGKICIYYLPDAYINLIKEQAKYNMFSRWTIDKAEEYISLDCISNFKFEDNYIIADVLGTNVYRTRLTFVKNHINYFCTCPVGRSCKHEYALLRLLYNQIIRVESLRKEYIENQFFIENRPIDINWLDFLEYICNKYGAEEFFLKLKFIDKFTENNYIQLLLLKYKLKTKQNRFYEMITSLNKNDTNLDLFINEKINGVLFNLAQSILTNDFSSIIYNFSQLFITLKNDDILRIFPSIIDLSFYNYLENYYYIDDGFLNFLINVSSYTTTYLKYIIKNIKHLHKNNLGYTIIKIDKLCDKISDEDFFNLVMDSIDSFDNYVLEMILMRINHCIDNVPTVFIDLLIKIAKNPKNINLDKVYELVDLLPYNNLIKILMSLYKIRFKNITLIEKDFCKYFKIDITNEIKSSWYNEFTRFVINLTLSTNNKSYILQEIVDLDFEGSAYYALNDDIIGESKVKFAKQVFNFLIENNLDDVSDKYKSFIKERDEKLLQIKKDELMQRFNNFSNLYSKSFASSYLSLAKYDIQPVFESNDNSYFTMRIKLGNKKFLFVKDLYQFVQCFKFNGAIELGKNDNFICNYDNLTERGQKVLKIISDIVDGYHYDTQTVPSVIIAPSTFWHILQLYKGENLIFDKSSIFNSLNKVSLNVKLNSDYKIEFGYKLFSIYPLYDRMLVIHDQQIDYCEYEDLPYPFLTFLGMLKDNDLSIVKEEFIENIYPLIADKIEIDDSIKDEFKLSILEIDSYFDYVNKNITLRRVLRYGNKEVNEDSIKDSLNLNKLNQYNKILLNLGVDLETYIINDDNDIYNFFKLDFSNLKKITNVYLSETLLNKKVIAFKSPKFKITYNNELMNCFYEQSEYSEEELYQIIKSIQNNKKYVFLNNDRIIELGNDDSNMFNSIVKELDLNPKHLYTEEHEPLYKSLKIANYINKCDVDDYIIQMINEIADFKNAKFEIPEVTCELRSYQIEGYKWLKILEKYSLGGILADDMGLGKSLEIICLLKSNTKQMPSLIVCPKSLIFNWINEFKKFDRYTEIIKIYGSSNERKDIITSIVDNKKVVYITSYDSLRNDIEFYNVLFNFVIIDEAQYIKNIEALKTRNVKQLKAQYKFALTGTPIENNLLDLWSIFDFIMPKYLDGVTNFKSNCQDEEYIKLVAKKTSPFILRRTKKEVLNDLPNKIERIVTAELNPSQRKIYDATCYDARILLEQTGKAFNVLHLLTKLRQICVTPNLIMNEYNESSGKIDTLVDIIQDYVKTGHRLLIFSQFVKALEYIEILLTKLDIKYFKLTGDTKAEKRISDMNEFNKNDKIKVYLISLKAGGTGLNLIGADTVIHLDPWWNVSSENQASDRVYRIGQTKNVEVIKLIAENSIEERVIELQQIKKDLIDKVISNDDSSITSLSKEDIEFLLK